MSKTLREDLAALLTLQAVDSRLDRAKATMAALDTGAAAAAAYNEKKAQGEVLQRAAHKAVATQKEAELKLASLEEKAAQVNKTLYGGTVSASRELENLQKEIEMLGRQKDAAEEEVLLAMEASGEADGAAKGAQEELQTLADRYRRIRTLWKQRQAELSAEVETLLPERAAAAAAVSRPEVLSRYEAIRPRRAGVGAAALGADDVCGACHTRVNSTLAFDARQGDVLQVCEHCGCILVPGIPPASVRWGEKG